MMNYLLFFISLFTFFPAVACICDPPQITDKYIWADVVAKVKILKNYPNESEKELYKANIQVIELYKGEAPEFLFVSGRSDGKGGSSCSIFIPEEAELIVYASKDKEGKHHIGLCSGLLFSEQFKKNQSLEIKILESLRRIKYDYQSSIIYRKRSTILERFIKEISHESLENNFALYEINFSKDVEIKNITVIFGFENEIDELVMAQIFKTKWRSFNGEKINRIPEDSKKLIGIYKYKDENGNYFLTTNFL